MIKPPLPFHFAVGTRRAHDAISWNTLATRVQDSGYHGFAIGDHVTGGISTFGTFTALTAAALAAPRLRVLPHVLAMDFRNPVLTVRELSTLDLLSGGRVTVGVGTGWSAEDYAATGVARDRGGVRIDRLGETVQLMKSLFAGGPLEFTGKFHQVSIADAQLESLQRPHPPFLMGGSGRRMLTLAAQEANIVSVMGSGLTGRLDGRAVEGWQRVVIDERIDLVGEAAGARFRDISLSTTLMLVAVSDAPGRVFTEGGNFDAAFSELGVPAEETFLMPSVLVGSLEHVVSTLLERRERWGFNHYVVPAAMMEEFAPVVVELAGR